MKITGVEGMSPEDIRFEIERGGKLVVYTYCVSIVVMTFKQPTDIRLVRAGHNPVVAGLPYTLISLFFGWWGIPWGPIYTIETIYRNLSGGIDVSADVLPAILPPPPVAATVASPAAAVTPEPRSYIPPQPRKSRPNYKTIGLMAGVAAFLVALGITLHCYMQQQSLKVALVSGLDHPYSVSLNGKVHLLPPHGSEVLELPEGDIVLADANDSHVVGKPQTLHFELPFFDHLFEEKLAVINPDATAIVYNQQVPYYKNGSTPATEPDPDFTLYVNRSSYFLDRPDYVLAPAPENISMPSGTTRVVKSRLSYISLPDSLGGILGTVKEKLGYPAVVEHFQALARLRTDEPVLSAAMANLQPADWPAFFRPRLAERPLLIEWHRYYQRAIEQAQPDHDLAGEYRGYLAAEPANGALLYLTGRILDDRAESHQLWQKALAVDPPCAYASAAFGFDAFSDGNFAQASAYYEACEKAGIRNQALDFYRRESYWAQRRFDKVLEMVRSARQKAPLNLNLAGVEISALLESDPAPLTARGVKDAYLTQARAAQFSESDLKDSEAYLDAIACYQTGQIPQYLAAVKKLDSPAYRFEAAVTRGDLRAAEAAHREEPSPQSSGFLLLYLLAKQTGNEDGAEKFFREAVTAMNTERRENRHAARLIGASTLPAAELCQLGLDATEKSILLTALGVRDPANRASYQPLAAKLNFSPLFPHRFLEGIHKL